MLPSLMNWIPQGSCSDRTPWPTKSSLMVRRMMSAPTVMMATENSGSPTIGLMKTLSTSSPTKAAAITAHSADRDHRAQMGRSGSKRPGTLRIVKNEAVRNAPIAASDPWAKLITWVALKMITKPRAKQRVNRPKGNAIERGR